jgi:hypothetical protein
LPHQPSSMGTSMNESHSLLCLNTDDATTG